MRACFRQGKEVAHLKFDEDLSLSEMAERLGISRQVCDDAVSGV